MPRSRPHPSHGDDEGEGTPSSNEHGRPHGGSESVKAAEGALSATLIEGRPNAARVAAASPAESRPAAHATGSGSAREFVDNIAGNPRSVARRSAQDIADQFNQAGFPATVEQSQRRGTSGRAVQVRVQDHPEIANVQVHPGGGRHTPEGSPYWKISTNTVGKIWVIPGDFRGADELGGRVVRYDE
jgi:hypothetical protein